MAATRGVRLFLTVLLLLLVTPRDGSACTCVADVPLCESFWNSAAVFAGEAVAVDVSPRSKGVASFPGGRRVRFNVERVWRGDVPESVEVITGGGGGDCGYHFRQGRKYLVYAAEEDGRLITHICAPTKPLERAASDLEYLNQVSAAHPAGRIYGSVRMANDRPAAGYTAVLSGPDGQRHTVANASGEFEFPVKESGSYTVRVVVHESERAFGREDVTLRDSRACARRDFTIERQQR